MTSTSLHRVLSRLDAISLGFGAMIGWGWVILAGTWISNAGVLGATAAFAIGAVAIIVIGLTYAELSSALPFAGGEHAYAKRAFGDAASFICTWAIIFGYVAVVAFEAIALPVAIVYLAPGLKAWPLWTVAGYEVHLREALIGAGAAVLITIINIIGIRLAARVQAGVIIVLLLAGVVLVTGGALHPQLVPADLPMWKGAGGVFTVIIMVPFLFVGFDVIPQSAEEISGAMSEIGRALVISVISAVVFYLLIVFTVGLAPIELGENSIASADAAGAWWGSQSASAVVIIAGIGGIITSWNAFLIGGSRAIFAMARDRQLPGAFGRIHEKFGTPWAAILLIGGISALAPLLGRNALVWIVNAGGFGIVIAYVFVAAAFIRLRIKEPELERPFRTPGGVATGWAAVLLGAALAVLYLPGSPAALAWPQEWGLLAAWTALGALLWAIRKRA